uniref:Putative helicase n=1 Tax=viral metagenome TaxID=1070528 RepID=A0A6M3JR20_9ZZZZ
MIDHQIACIISGLELDYERLIEYTPDHFLGSARKIFQTLLALHRTNPPVEESFLLVHLEEGLRKYYLKSKKQFDPDNIGDCFVKLEETFNDNQLKLLGNELRKGIISVPEKLSLIDQTMKAMESGRDLYSISVGQSFDDVLLNIEKGTPPIIPYYIEPLDMLLGGIFLGSYIVIGARTSVGKTATAIQIHKNISIDNKIPTAIITMEMQHDELTPRLICNIADINLRKFQSYNFTKKEINSIKQAGAILKDSPLYIVNIPNPNVYSILKEVRRLQKAYGIQLVTIDFIQKLLKTDNKQSELTSINNTLFLAAKELRMPMVCISQLNRSVEQDGKDKKPELIHLKESGSIEESADVVILLYRESYYNRSLQLMESQINMGDTTITDPKLNEIEFIVRKNRNGPTGTIKCMYYRDTQRIIG